MASKADLSRHDQRVGDERVRVRVERVGTSENEGIANEMKHEIREKGQTGQSDEQFGSDR